MRRLIFLSVLMMSIGLQCQEEVVQVSIAAAAGSKRAKTPLLLVAPGHDPLLDRLLAQLQKDLERSKECVVTIRYETTPITKGLLEKMFVEGFPFVGFLALAADKQALEGRLYASVDHDMLQGKKWAKRDSLAAWSAKISQDMWLQLMGNPGSFISKIAYIQKTKGRSRHPITSLCIIDWSTGNKEVIRTGNAIMIAPYFKPDGKLLFFSEFTNRNVRLMVTNMQGKSWCVVDGDGTCVGLSFLPNLEDVIYGRSGEIWQYHYDETKRQGVHSLLIKDQGECACPIQLRNGDIIYCASGRIWLWSVSTKKAQTISGSGYCTGPAYHEPTGRVVYSQRINRTMQIFIYDMKSQQRTQLTFDAGDKIDPTISPCGVYVAYCLSKGTESHIAVLNTIWRTTERISPAQEHCSCPSWSSSLAV